MRSIFTDASGFYPILTPPEPNEQDFLKAFDALGRAGVKIVQLREKRLSAEALERLAVLLVKRAQQLKIRLVINDDFRLAQKVGADGVHLGQRDGSIEKARRTGLEIIGVSAQTVPEALKAQMSGADYIGVGPVFLSPTKPQRKPVGLNTLSRIRKEIHIPLVAIGGIRPETMQDCLTAGADAVSVISALLGSSDTYSAAQAFLRRARLTERTFS